MTSGDTPSKSSPPKVGRARSRGGATGGGAAVTAAGAALASAARAAARAAASAAARIWAPASYAGVAALSVALHANTLEGGFVWDDRAAVVQNRDVRPSTPLRELLRHDFWGQPIDVHDSHKARDLRALSRALSLSLSLASSESARGTRPLSPSLASLRVSARDSRGGR